MRFIHRDFVLKVQQINKTSYYLYHFNLRIYYLRIKYFSVVLGETSVNVECKIVLPVISNFTFRNTMVHLMYLLNLSTSFIQNSL